MALSMRTACAKRVAVAAAPRIAIASTRRSGIIARAAELPQFETVQDVMQTNQQVISCRPETTVDEALEMLVRYNISGLVVLDATDSVVGMVSDFDLLALESVGRTNIKKSLFPDADQTWKAFNEVKIALSKGTGKLVADVMTPEPLVVRPGTSIDAATKILVTKKIRRLPVVDEKGRMLGAISRRDIVKAAFAARKGSLDKKVFISLDDE